MYVQRNYFVQRSDVLIFRILDTTIVFTRARIKEGSLNYFESKLKRDMELNILFFMFLTNVKSMLQYRMM